jgi:hypothetical protein
LIAVIIDPIVHRGVIEHLSMTMLKHMLTACVASLTFALSAPVALAGNSTDGVVVFSPIEGVTVITTSVTETDVEGAETAPAIVNYNNVVVVIAAPSRRLAALRRAFGYRYTGFHRVYSGPRYPF